jgi:uncharacterized protein YgiM (DUF1202 family)
VGNGGNVRAQPSASAELVGQVVLGDEIEVLERTADGIWFKINSDQGFEGWAHRVVLNLDPGTVAQVPIQGQGTPPESAPDAEATGLTATVFNGGNMRASPVIANNVVGGVNAGEMVELLAKTGDGVWYQVRNVRGVVGWTHNTLLTLPPDVAAQVPVAQG